MLTYFRCVGGRIEQHEFKPELLRESEGALHWIDLEDPSVRESTILEDPFHFHPLAIEDCLAEVHHPKVDDYEGYLFIILHGIRFDAPTDQFITPSRANMPEPPAVTQKIANTSRVPY